eukprot:4318821-Pyramimonas_sp.AAC.1
MSVHRAFQCVLVGASTSVAIKRSIAPWEPPAQSASSMHQLAPKLAWNVLTGRGGERGERGKGRAMGE